MFYQQNNALKLKHFPSKLSVHVKLSGTMNQIICFLIIASVAATLAFPDGAPESVCTTKFPDHGFPPLASFPPVRILLSRNRIRPGDTITITIESINPAFMFRGFMLQPRNVVAPNSALGTVLAGAGYQTVNCGGPTTATHVNNAPRNVQTITWTAPQFTGGIRAQ